MGSVKDLEILKQATPDEFGRGRFIFSDRYSVFDWGEMPDHIDHKGAAIALLGAYFFERLEEEGIPTHYEGLVENGAAKRLAKERSEFASPTSAAGYGLFSQSILKLGGQSEIEFHAETSSLY